MSTVPQDYYFCSREEYDVARIRYGLLGPMGPIPVALIPMRVGAPTLRRPIAAARTAARPPAPFNYTPRVSARPSALPPKTCASCGTAISTPWLQWSTCACGRVRPPSPAEQAAQLRLRLAVALGHA